MHFYFFVMIGIHKIIKYIPTKIRTNLTQPVECDGEFAPWKIGNAKPLYKHSHTLTHTLLLFCLISKCHDLEIAA